MTIIDNLQSLWDTGLSSQTEETVAAETSENEALNQGFSGLFSMLQGENSDGESGDAQLGTEAVIDSIQQSLMSAMGFTNALGDGVSKLSSLSSIANMQSSLLSSLQASLFSSATESASSFVGETTSIVKGVEEFDSFSNTWNAIDDVSDYLTGADGLAFADVFDSVNILNHVPLISDVYQNEIEHEISPISELVGGYAFGGPVGLAYSAADLAIESISGKSIYENISDFLFSDAEQESIENTVTQVTDTILQTNQAYSFVRRHF
ncbi:MAG: hypothetical protein ABJH06_18340 [Paraglaciecola sp.]|uniref:hypothetical protein n=1 Tax=Paraglaciecola sp. TaxID=1920173 RepID=UPI0032993926